MPSFQIAVSPKRRAAVRFISDVRRALQRALIEAANSSGLTQAEIARRLEIDRSVVNRELRGAENLSLGRVAELAWAMGCKPYFELRASAPNVIGVNEAPLPSPAPPADEKPLNVKPPCNPFDANKLVRTMATA